MFTVRALLSTAAVVAATLTGPAVPASALPVPGLVCLITFQFDFGSSTLTETNAYGATTSCHSPDGSATHLSGNIFAAEGTATACPQLTIEGDGTIVWFTRDLTQVTSEFTFVVNINPLNGPITLSATITDGELAGATATAVPAIALAELASCPGPVPQLPGFRRITSELATITFTH